MTSTPAQYAVTENTSRGRQHDEPPHRYRTAFERDRDRVIHCAAFRRLEGKTQVFTTGLNDQYRTRLTHTIEVAQIGRTLARCLNLNEALTEAICLAHDLGHAPFGHNGEGVLNGLMKDHGGFEHNRQSLRIVDFIERPYPDFIGLNLSFETRLGLMKHASPYDKPEATGDWPKHPTLEGQIADIADRIAYNCHDLEDGLRSRLLDESQLEGLSLYQQACKKAGMDTITDTVIRRTRLAKTMLDILASDAIETSRANLAAANIKTLDEVLNYPQMLIGISQEADAALQQLEAFLMQNMYLNPALSETAQKTKGWLSGLFEHFTAHPDKMPRYYQHMIDTETLQRTVCDYIAGMTDRYCLKRVEDITLP